MTWEQWLGLIGLIGPLYAKLIIEVIRWRRNGKDGNGAIGKLNPSPEYHALDDRLVELRDKMDRLAEEVRVVDRSTFAALNILERNVAVLTEKVSRLETE